MFRMYVQSRPQVILAVLRELVEKSRFTTATVEQGVQQVSNIARGHYQAVAQAGEASVTASAAADAPDSELSAAVGLKLQQRLADFARTLAEQDGAQAAGQAT
jgi:plasmid replication initiation protein